MRVSRCALQELALAGASVGETFEFNANQAFSKLLLARKYSSVCQIVPCMNQRGRA